MAEEKDGAPPPDPSQETLAYLQHLQASIQPLTRSAAQLSGPSDLQFHRSLDKSLARSLDDSKTDVLQTISELLACIISPGGSSSRSIAAKNDAANDAVSLDDLVEAGAFERRFGDVIDTLLEKTDTRLDEFQGKVNVRAATTRSAFNGRSAGTEISAPVGPLPPHILNAPIRPLPQQRFEKQPDNSRERAWQHSLDTKPHAQVPLTWRAPSFQEADGGGQRVGVRQGMYCAEGDPRENPYYYEINNLAPPEHALLPIEMEALQAPPPLNKDDPSGGPIPFTWVDSEATFDELYEHLMEERVLEVAVDVEHHNYRSYQGLVCLVQISTRWHDYILDTLSPTIREHSHKLNDVYADPNKVKILHGAEHDILWLQRDLNVYIVGLFDTYHATNVLNFTQHGLAFLLHRYIDFVADKRYQLADWRIRPLPDEMLFYARSDTHSLLYVYDCLRFEIAQQFGPTGIRTVFENSKRTASKTYAKEEWNDGIESREGWRYMWKRLGGAEALGADERWDSASDPAMATDSLTRTERLFRALHDWRDRTARAMDESPRYVLSSANLLNLSSRAPETREAVVSCVGPALKKRSGELLKVIEDETKAYEAAQTRKAARQRKLLELAAAGRNGGSDDEMGEVMDRGTAGPAQVHLWPVEQAVGTDQASSSVSVPSSQSSAGSRLAKWLFSPGGSASAPDLGEEAAAVPSKRASIFTPISKTQSSQHLVHSIRSDITHALRGVFGDKRSVAKGAEGEAVDEGGDDGEAMSEQQERADGNAVESVEVFSPVSSEEQQASATDAGDGGDDDGILQIRRKVKGKKKDKKRAAGDETVEDGGEGQTTLSLRPKEGKKRKWTKEEKAERKRLQQESAAVSSNVTPFDYSTAVSVLDARGPPPTTKTDAKKKRGDKAKDKSDSASGSQKPSKGSDESKSPRGQGRYANVPVGRDRREQAAGKSKTFSR